MRRHLLQTFDKIYVLDLHGNAKKKEVSPDGSADKNVFDIHAGRFNYDRDKDCAVNQVGADQVCQQRIGQMRWLSTDNFGVGERVVCAPMGSPNSRRRLGNLVAQYAKPLFCSSDNDFGKTVYKQGFSVET